MSTATPIPFFTDDIRIKPTSITGISKQNGSLRPGKTCDALVSGIAWMLEATVSIREVSQSLGSETLSTLYRHEDGSLELKVIQPKSGQGVAVRGAEVSDSESEERPLGSQHYDAVLQL